MNETIVVGWSPELGQVLLGVWKPGEGPNTGPPLLILHLSPEVALGVGTELMHVAKTGDVSLSKSNVRERKGLLSPLFSDEQASLQCGTCLKIQDCSPKQAAEYMRDGWPTCCGFTMTLTSSTVSH